MTLAANVGGVFKSAKKYSVNVGGSWKEIKKAWVRDGGLWKPYYSPISGTATMIASLTNLGLLTGLRVCLDAGDIASFPNSTYTKWLDTSGNGEDFFRGSSTSVEASDPAFVGTAGTLVPPSHFTLREQSSNSDRFIYDAANPAWIEPLHKTGAKWTQCAWVRLQDTNARTNLLFTSGAAAISRGFFYSIKSPPTGHAAGISNGNASNYWMRADTTTLVSPANNIWHFVGVSFDTTAPMATFVVNDAVEQVVPTVRSTASSDVASGFAIGLSYSIATGYLMSNYDVAKAALWDRALSGAELTGIFTAQREMFSI